jgi:hypothetical protein
MDFLLLARACWIDRLLRLIRIADMTSWQWEAALVQHNWTVGHSPTCRDPPNHFNCDPRRPESATELNWWGSVPKPYWIELNSIFDEIYLQVQHLRLPGYPPDVRFAPAIELLWMQKWISHSTIVITRRLINVESRTTDRMERLAMPRLQSWHERSSVFQFINGSHQV